MALPYPVVETRLPEPPRVPLSEQPTGMYGTPRRPSAAATQPVQTAQPYPVVETRIPAGPQPIAPAANMAVRPASERPGGIYGMMRRPSAVVAQAAQPAADPSQIPGQSYTAPPSPGAAAAPARAAAPGPASVDAGVIPNVRAVLRTSGADAEALAARGNYAGALGAAARGLVAAVPAAGVDAYQGIVAPWVNAGGRAISAFAGDAAPAPAVPARPATAAAGGPAAAPAPAAATGPNARDQLLDRAAAGEQVMPGVRRFVDAQGRVLYTDQPTYTAGTGPVAAAAPAGEAPAANVVQSGLSSATEQRLAQARAAAAARGESVGPSAAANLPAGYGATIGRDPAAERNAQFDREVLINRANRVGGRGGKAILDLVSGGDRNAAETANTATREAGATERQRVQEQGATTRNRETIAAQEQREGPLRAAQTTEAQVKAAGAVAIQKAQADYQRAVASGDKAAIQKAEDALRAAQGKWEKTQPDAFTAVAVPGGVDPATGLPTGSSVVVVNKSTGETRTMPAGEVKAGGAKPQQKFETGKVYRDAQGNRAKWNGSKFVPV